MASERAMVLGFCGSKRSLLFLTASEIGEQPVACAPKNFTGFASTRPSAISSSKAFLILVINVVVPMAGGSLITKIKKAFDELIALGLVDAKPVKFFCAQATGCSPISTACKAGRAEIEPQKPATIARSLAIGNPADGHYAIKAI